MRDLTRTPVEELPNVIEPLDRVSENFQFFELHQSNTAARRGIDNRPKDPAIVKALVFHAREVLQPLRDKFGPLRPNSVYRSPELNAAVGGNPKSQHLAGEASDVEFAGVPNIALAEWIFEHLEFDQLILECYRMGEPSSGWVHVSRSFEGENREEALSYVWNDESGQHEYLGGLVAAPLQKWDARLACEDCGIRIEGWMLEIEELCRLVYPGQGPGATAYCPRCGEAIERDNGTWGASRDTASGPVPEKSVGITPTADAGRGCGPRPASSGSGKAMNGQTISGTSRDHSK